MRIFSNKQGELTFTLQRLIEIVIGIIILLGLLAFLVTVIVALTFKEPTLEETDFKRVLAEVNSLKKGSDSIIIPIFSEEIGLNLVKTSNAMFGCDKNTVCLCYFKEGKLTPVECESSTIDLKKIPLNIVAPTSPNKGGVVLAENKKIMLKIEGVDVSLEKVP